jgi:hypothetical protein
MEGGVEGAFRAGMWRPDGGENGGMKRKAKRSRMFVAWLVGWGTWLFLGGMVCWGQAAMPEMAKAELERCERRIREVKTEIAHKYEAELGKVRQAFQKSADLEGALLVREEERRLLADAGLESGHLKKEPAFLRELQEVFLQKQLDLVSQVVRESLPKLVEIKKQLTVAGRLDEAVEVRAAVGRLQKQLGPARRVSEGTALGVDDLVQAYQVDRERAETMYRGVRLALSGRVWGTRPEGREGGSVLVLAGGAGGGEGAAVECGFAAGEYRWIQETQGQTVVLGLQPAGSRGLLWKGARGTVLEVVGRCEGWGDGGLRLSNCTTQKR